MRNVNLHITIMSVIGLIMSMLGMCMTGNPIAILMLGILPIISIILFWTTKKPVFGIIYTVLFFLNRTSILWKGLLLAKVMTVAMITYFIYVIWLCIKARNEEYEEYDEYDEYEEYQAYEGYGPYNNEYRVNDEEF